MKKPGILKRTRVSRALESILDFSITIIEAPIGYGNKAPIYKGCNVFFYLVICKTRGGCRKKGEAV